jgi:Tfp pilus assembly protein PilF
VDRAKAIFAQLVDAGDKVLDKETAIQSIATVSQRAKVADAHYLAGLGQLGLKNLDQARQEFSRALEASPDHYAAMRALTEMRP